MPETLAEATAAAEAEQARYLDLQHRALHAEPAERPAPGDVVAASRAAELAQQRVGIAREREEQAREAARIAGLEAVGADVVSYAATDPDGKIRAALEKAAEAIGAYRAEVGAHDSAVADLCKRAAAFADATGRTLPVARGQGASSVRYGETEVRRIGDSARIALEDILAGDLPKARGRITAVRDRSPRTPTAYYLDMVGQFGMMPVYGQMPRSITDMVAEGRARLMTPEEVARWQASRQ